MDFKINDRVLITKSSIHQDNGLDGIIVSIDVFEGDYEVLIKTSEGMVLCHEGEFKMYPNSLKVIKDD